MNTQDFGVLFICALAIFISFRQGQFLSFNFAWVQPVDTESWTNKRFPDPSEMLPVPVITDLDGDGINEMITTTADSKIKIFDIPPELDGSIVAEHLPLKRVATLLAKIGARTGRRPVALATGYLTSPWKKNKYVTEEERQQRTQVIVVVTNGWTVLMFDHKLKLIWETTVHDDVSPLAYHAEVSILIDHHNVRIKDEGVVIVGGRLTLQNSNGDFGAVHHEHHENRGEKQELRDLDEDSEEYDHFSYYALDGKTGALRWSHEPGDFEEENSHEGEENSLLPPHSYKLHVMRHEKHIGEVDWREFESYMMTELPHKWFTRDDTSFSLAHFARDWQSGRKRKDPNKEASSWSTEAVGIPTDHHIHEIGLPFGGLQAHKEDDHVENPNVIVVHNSRGIEVIHLYTGRPLCKMVLEDGVYEDINGDGVIDRARALTGDLTGSFSSSPTCLAYVTTGVTVKVPYEVLYNSTICRPKGGLLESLWQKTKIGISRKQKRIERKASSTNPLVVNYHRSIFRTPTSQEKDVVFLINDGRVTSYRLRGRQNWHVQTESSWGEFKPNSRTWFYDPTIKVPHKDEYITDAPILPQLELFHPVVYGNMEYILVVGQYITLLDLYGTILAEVRIDSGVPISKVLIVDIDNDGLNDILVTTNTGYFAYLLRTSSGSYALTSLMGFLIFIIVVIFLVQYQRRRKRKFGKVSTQISSQKTKRKQKKRLSSRKMWEERQKFKERAY